MQYTTDESEEEQLGEGKQNKKKKKTMILRIYQSKIDYIKLKESGKSVVKSDPPVGSLAKSVLDKQNEIVDGLIRT